MAMNTAEYRELVHRMFEGKAKPADLRAKGLPPFTGRRVMQRQGRLEFEAGAPRPHGGAEALTAAQG